MIKKVIAGVLLCTIAMSGCAKIGSNQQAETNPDTVVTTVGETTQHSTTQVDTNDPSVPTSGSFSDHTECYDTYHSGKPYTSWGVPESIALSTENGNSVSFTGNIPEETIGIQLTSNLWKGSPNNLGTKFMLLYIPVSEQVIESPESFFEDMGEAFTTRYFSRFNAQAKDAQLDVRGADPVTKNGIKMCRTIGSVQWIYKNAHREYSFVSYVFQAPDGGYLCCLFQNTEKDWPGTQEAAENFVNTFQWRNTNGS